MHIRLVQKKDIEVLGEVYAKAYVEMDVDEEWTVETARDLMWFWFEKQPDLFYVAEEKREEGKIIGGFVAGIKPWWDGNHVNDGEIFVHPNYQGKGVGGELMKKVLKRVREKYNVKIVEFITFRNKEFPLKWYKKIGFKEIEEWILIEGSVDEVLGNLG